MSEPDVYAVWFTNKQQLLKTAMENHRTGEQFKVRVRSDTNFIPLDIYDIDNNVLTYNFDNIRISAEKAHKEEKLKHKLDPMIADHQQIVEDILYASKFYSASATKELETDLINIGQSDPAIVSVDGVVWNGNRRLAIRRKLFKSTGRQEYSRTPVVVLPTMTAKELKLLERRLQMRRDWKEDYGSIQTRIDVRQSIDSNWDPKELAASYGNRYTESLLIAYKQEIDLIDDYLVRIKSPKNYASLRKKSGVESFVTLNQILQSEYDKGTKDIDIEKIKLLGFLYIYADDITYRDMRDFHNILKNYNIRSDHFTNSTVVQKFKKVSNKPFTKLLASEELDGLRDSSLSLRQIKAKPSKIINTALKTLMKIKQSKITGDKKFSQSLNKLSEKVLELQSMLK